jgi:hypothetical protein
LASVIHYSEFYRGSDVDSGQFQQLTIYVPHGNLRAGSHLTTNDFQLYYSGGSTVWMQQGQGVYGTSARGGMLVREVTTERLMLDIDLEIDVQFANQPRKDVRRINLHRAFRGVDLGLLQTCLGIYGYCPS